MKDLKTTTQQSLTLVNRRLEKVRAKQEFVNAKVLDLERQQAALQSALDILNSNSIIIPPWTPSFTTKTVEQLAKETWTSSTNLNGKTVEMHGETIVLEPGFELKNGALVPIGFDPNPVVDNSIPPVLPHSKDESFAPDGPLG